MSSLPASPLVVRNPVRDRVNAGEVAFGMAVRVVRSGEISLIARASGHDYLYIDAQHAVFDLETVATIAQTALAADVAPFVRVVSANDTNIPLMLDAGVLGIVAPDIVSADQARRLVELTKYPPVGRRSLAGMTIHNGFAPIPAAEQMRAENEAVMLFCMIESAAGLAAIDEIAAVPGLDGLYVGLNDLLADMGIPGQHDGPEVDEALRAVVEASLRHGLVPGAGGAPIPEQQVKWIRAGIRFLMSSSDIGLIRKGGIDAIARIRERLDAKPVA